MRFSATTLFTLLPVAILAAPTTLESRGAEICAPTQYTLSDYFLTYSTETAHVEFKFASEFADPSIIQDAVIDGASCAASGETIPNNNECAVPGRNLLFDLAGAQQTAKYMIVHSWRCNGRTWMSNTPIEADFLLCNHQGSTGVTECHGEQNLVFTPQNVRQICSTPTCP